MSAKFEEVGETHELSSIRGDPTEFKSSTIHLHRINDSFDSYFITKNGSDSSFVSQVSFDDIVVQNINPVVNITDRSIKNNRIIESETVSNKPASILKTTFLSDDVINYNFPKKPSVPKETKAKSDLNCIDYSDNVSHKPVSINYSSSTFHSHRRTNSTQLIEENNKEQHPSNPLNSHRPNPTVQFIDQSYKVCENKDQPSNNILNSHRPNVPLIEENFKVYENKDQHDKIRDLENQITKKDSLIETLRIRVSKMVQELEETHTKLKAIVIDDSSLKIQQLTKKCENYQEQIRKYESREKDILNMNTQKEQEFIAIDKEIKQKKNEIESKSHKIEFLETELKKSNDAYRNLEKIYENLQIKLENTANALDLANSHRNHLEQEVVRLEIVKRTQENEMKVILEENPKQAKVFNKKLEEANEEIKSYQQKLSESSLKLESLNNDYIEINQKLLLLEKKRSSQETNNSKSHSRSISSYVPADNKLYYSKIGLDRHFTFQGPEPIPNHHHQSRHKGSSSVKAYLKEIMDLLNLDDMNEIIPAIKKQRVNKKEKKLVRKLASLINECFSQDKNDREIPPAKIWKVVKKVFEEYAALQKYNMSEINLIKHYLGDGNIVENISNICQELKLLNAFVSKVKNKLNLPSSASFTELENAIGTI